MRKKSRIKCDLQIISLDTVPVVEYTALSYVWGDVSVTEDISINGTTASVTTNLAAALRHIREVFGEGVLWADAICRLALQLRGFKLT